MKTVPATIVSRMHHPSRRGRGIKRPLIAGLLSLAVAALGGCETPFGADSAGNFSPYNESLIVRSIIDNTRDLTHTPTYDRGVREMVRVDDAGPGIGTGIGGPAGAVGSLTGPAATRDAPPAPTIAEAVQSGLRSSQLNHDESARDLSLHDAISRAVQHSLAIKVEGYNPAIKEAQIVEAMAAFDPSLFGQHQWNSNDNPINQTGLQPNGQVFNNTIGIKQTLTSGAQVQLAAGVNYNDTTIPPGGVNSLTFRTSYSTNIGVQVTQPLLRGFGTEINEANIYLAQRDLRISLATFRRQVITTVADTEQAYYDLVVAYTNVETLKRLVGASAQTYRTILDRVPIDATAASVNQALSALESRRADLLQAQLTYRKASDKLKNLINDPDLDLSDFSVIVPTDRPTAELIYYSTAESIELALRQRTEIQEARLQVERADIVITVAKNDLLPKVDLIVGIQTNGLDNSFDAAFGSTINGLDFIDYSAGIKWEFALGNREAEAVLNRRRHEREQAVAQMMRVAQQVVEDVKDQMRNLLSAYEEMEIRERVRAAAAREFAALIQLGTIHAMTPEFLQLELDSQARLAQAEQQLTQAIVTYNLSVMKLEQAKGTLLEFNQISLDRPPIDHNEDAGKSWFMGRSYNNK